MVSATAAMVDEEEEEGERVGEEEDLDRRFPNVSAALNRILKAAIFSFLLNWRWGLLQRVNMMPLMY